MATPTSASIIAAARDRDLLDRMVALGSTLDPPLTQADVESMRTRLAAAPAGDGDSTIASIYEYAVATYTPTPRPGENPAAVTDSHIISALESLRGSEI